MTNIRDLDQVELTDLMNEIAYSVELAIAHSYSDPCPYLVLL